MLGLTETLLFYSLIGIGVAAAVLLRDDSLTFGERGFRVATAVVFWPVYVPVLLQRPGGSSVERVQDDTLRSRPSRPPDEMDSAIEQVEAELETAVKSLGGWAESVLSREDARFSELRDTWRFQADRIRELDALLIQPEFVVTNRADDDCDEPRRHHSEESRHKNIERLRVIRQQRHEDLLGTLAWVRELVTMIHLAKFTGAPASRAEELVAQIAAAVQGLSEVAEWRDDDSLQSVYADSI